MNVRDRFEKNVEIREPRKEHGERTMKGTDCEMGRKKSISTGVALLMSCPCPLVGRVGIFGVRLPFVASEDDCGGGGEWAIA
jgi:hypothetical protein